MTKFNKYHGAGNDFILFDGITEEINLSSEQILKICNRRFGIGADGVMILRSHDEFDFEMDYYNSDGTGGTMCGNGGRCIVAFAEKLGIINNYTKFFASDGIHEAHIYEDYSVNLKMADVENVNRIGEDYTCYTGSPHYIKFEDNINKTDVFNEGRKIRNSDSFIKEGINVNFAEIIDSGTLNIRTYERGVENETLACGTGSVAAALTFAEINNEISGEYIVNVKGGTLKVSFEKKDNLYVNIWLKGPTKFVFEGFYNL